MDSLAKAADMMNPTCWVHLELPGHRARWFFVESPDMLLTPKRLVEEYRYVVVPWQTIIEWAEQYGTPELFQELRDAVLEFEERCWNEHHEDELKAQEKYYEAFLDAKEEEEAMAIYEDGTQDPDASPPRQDFEKDRCPIGCTPTEWEELNRGLAIELQKQQLYPFFNSPDFVKMLSE
jgi:hypothetical protein